MEDSHEKPLQNLIPFSYSHFPDWLNSENNDLTGTIPSEIALLTSLGKALGRFDCFHCRIFVYNSISVAHSQSIGSLLLNNNKLTGMIPTEIASMSSLGECLQSRLRGLLVHSILSSFPALPFFMIVSLFLYRNNFTGEFTCPDFIEKCAISCVVPHNVSCRSLWLSGLVRLSSLLRKSHPTQANEHFSCMSFHFASWNAN